MKKLFFYITLFAYTQTVAQSISKEIALGIADTLNSIAIADGWSDEIGPATAANIDWIIDHSEMERVGGEYYLAFDPNDAFRPNTLSRDYPKRTYISLAELNPPPPVEKPEDQMTAGSPAPSDANTNRTIYDTVRRDGDTYYIEHYHAGSGGLDAGEKPRPRQAGEYGYNYGYNYRWYPQYQYASYPYGYSCDPLWCYRHSRWTYNTCSGGGVVFSAGVLAYVGSNYYGYRGLYGYYPTYHSYHYRYPYYSHSPSYSYSYSYQSGRGSYRKARPRRSRASNGSGGRRPTATSSSYVRSYSSPKTNTNYAPKTNYTPRTNYVPKSYAPKRNSRSMGYRYSTEM